MMTSRISCSITFSRMEVRLTGLYFPGSSFLPFLKIGVTLAFHQSSGTSPVLQDLSKMMESASAMTSASSLSTLKGQVTVSSLDICKYSAGDAHCKAETHNFGMSNKYLCRFLCLTSVGFN